MQLVDQPNSTFTNLELARLAAYRAAVVAGFYTDWDGSATCTDTEVLAWLPRVEGVEGADVGAAYPFTAEERVRLEQLRVAFGAGGFADDRPAAPASPSAASADAASADTAGADGTPGATTDDATR